MIFLPKKKLKSITILLTLTFLASSTILGSTTEVVTAKNFEILATQEVKFVPLKKYDVSVFNAFPKIIDLKANQSPVKSQGQRGACTYFVISSLIESLIHKSINRTIDISEEHMAWVSKEKGKMRANEEDSSVAVNAAAVQKFGFMLEVDLPYQPSWFDKGMPCEGKKNKSHIEPICFSHNGPDPTRPVINGKNFIFEAVDSSSLDVVQAMSRLDSPVTASILAHPLIWSNSRKNGKLNLTSKLKKECQNNKVSCSAHAVLIVGYNLEKKIFTFKNSWGEDWGNNGYGSISFDYIDQMSPRKFLTGYIDGKIALPGN
ncbi:MAG: C1 family peptidase [Pseudobdellovibrio sp.]